MENNKYYLISYSYNDKDYGLRNAMETTEEDVFDWILGMINFDKNRRKEDPKRYTNFVLLNFWEISKEQYEKMAKVI